MVLVDGEERFEIALDEAALRARELAPERSHDADSRMHYPLGA